MRTFSIGLITAVATAALVIGNCAGANAQIVIKLGHDQPATSSHQQAALKWKQLVEERTHGQITVNIFPAMMLGSGTQMVEQVEAGAIEAAILPTGWIAPIAPGVQVLDLPFLFPNREVAYKVIDGPVGAQILKPLEQENIEGIAFWESGFKQFTADFPIREPSDYKGHKIRTMPAPVIQEQFKAFGAIPAAIDFKELYSALQQHVVDGEENPIATIALMRFYEVQKYLTISDHGFIAYVFMVNKPFLDKLTPDQRKILIDSAKEAGQYQRELIRASEKGFLEKFREAGVQISTLTPEQREKFIQASKPVYDWFIQKQGSATLDLIRNEVAAVTKK
jgi:C4-dicarboxylate-binding protein DctP